MKKLALLIAVVVSASSILLSTPLARTSAQANSPTNNGNVGQALEIAPPVITLNADPGQTIKANINLRAVVNSKLIVTSQINNFTAAGEDGTPKILTDTDDTSPYSLKTWVTPIPQMILNPREIKVLPITITIPADAAPGGYYGVVRFTARPPELDSTGVALSASLGSLLFIRVNGKANESMKIAEFSVSKNGKKHSVFESTPLQFSERLKNDGNVFSQPAGQITIKDMFGKKVAALNINLPPRNVLPQSIRKFDQPLDSSTIGNKKLFGRYTAELKVTYGADKQVVTSTVTFWVIPYRLVGAIIVFLIVAFFVLRFTLIRYNRRIINKAQGGSRRRR